MPLLHLLPTAGHLLVCLRDRTRLQSAGWESSSAGQVGTLAEYLEHCPLVSLTPDTEKRVYEGWLFIFFFFMYINVKINNGHGIAATIKRETDDEVIWI